GFVLRLLVMRDRPIDLGPVDAELGGQDLEEARPPGRAEPEIDRCDAGGLGPRQGFAAARLEAGAHFGPQLVGLIRPEIRVVAAEKRQPGARRDVADRPAPPAERATDERRLVVGRRAPRLILRRPQLFARSFGQNSPPSTSNSAGQPIVIYP